MATIEQIKDLREKTGAGMNAVREALEASSGDMEKALVYLREKGIAKAEKRKDRSASKGRLGVYLHSNNSVVVVVEVNCETDFAANSADMIKFADEIAVHIAAVNPMFISEDSVDTDELEKQKQTWKTELEGKPEEVQAKIMEGKIDRYYQEKVLLRQPLFQENTKTVGDYLNELVAKIGEKIEISKFYYFEVAQPVTFSEVA